MIEKISMRILGKGTSKMLLRKEIFEKVKNIVTTNVSDSLTSNELNVYIEKIARNAYKIVDEDMEALKQSGLSEEEIYELTVVAAYSAGVTRVELATKLLD